MRFQKPLTRWALGLAIMAMALGGCSKKDTVKPVTIPDSLAAGKNAGKKRSPGSEYDTLWDRLFALYALPPVENSDIDREISWFANHPAYLERAQNRADPFLYSIVKYIEKQGVPGELALLPIVESAFQPHVVSPARAAGIWQFIPTTGTHYGLKRNHTYDGRRDVYASTKAAVRYLKKLHGDFGDWLLAIAAYNCGEGAVGKAVRRNEAAGLPTDFWSLNLPRETRAYVPKLLAVSRIFADSDRYGIPLREMPNSAKYKPVKVTSRLDLALAADAAGISLDKLYELNPGFRGQVADVEGSYHLYIPAHKKAADFRQEVERLKLERGAIMPAMAREDLEGPDTNTFEVFRRESLLRREASAAGADASDSRQESSQRMVSTDSGQFDEATSSRRNAEPSRSESRNVDARKAEPARPGREIPDVRETSHSVKRGETLYEIARRFSVSPSQLAKWNDIPATTEVRVGQKLIVSENQESLPSGSRKGAEASRHSRSEPESKSGASKHGDTHAKTSLKAGKIRADATSRAKGAESKAASHDKKGATGNLAPKSRHR